MLSVILKDESLFTISKETFIGVDSTGGIIFFTGMTSLNGVSTNRNVVALDTSFISSVLINDVEISAESMKNGLTKFICDYFVDWY